MIYFEVSYKFLLDVPIAQVYIAGQTDSQILMGRIMAIRPFLVQDPSGFARSIDVDALKRGDNEAVAALWDCYFPRLVRYFSNWFRRRPRPVVDEEDLALDVIDRTCRYLKSSKRYDDFVSLSRFEHLLFVVARRQLLSQRRFDRRMKRDTGFSQQSDDALSRFLQPGRGHVAIFDLEHDVRLAVSLIPNRALREFFRQWLEGRDVREISRGSGRAPCTIRRNLRSVRALWAKDLACYG